MQNGTAVGVDGKEPVLKNENALVTVPLQMILKMKFSENETLNSSAAWLECDATFAELSDIAKVLLDLQKLKETSYFEMMKKIV